MPVSKDFNPRSPCGERPRSFSRFYKRFGFQSTLPVWGATSQYFARESISFYFNPRSPCGERPNQRSGNPKILRFQSTLPVWGATRKKGRWRLHLHISIHAPRVGSDYSQTHLCIFLRYFNPRSPCGERPIYPPINKVGDLFQSTLPVWGATLETIPQGAGNSDFNPRSPCGERLTNSILD